MIILSRKRIISVVSMVFVALFVFVLQTSKLDKFVATVSLPVSNKVIVIDAGHGVPDEGAESKSGISEAEINLKIALKVQSL